jgi:hemoglobin
MNDPFKEFGEDGFRALAAAFYRRVRVDDVVGVLYHRDRLDHAETELLNFLIIHFGGSNHYPDQSRPPYLGRRHLWMSITPRQRDRWLEMMGAAMDEINLTGPARQRLNDFFTDTANALVTFNDETPRPADSPEPLRKRFDVADDSDL